MLTKRIFKSSEVGPTTIIIKDAQDEAWVNMALGYAQDCGIKMYERKKPRKTAVTIRASEMHARFKLDRD